MPIIAWFRVDVELPKKYIWKSAIYHSIKLPFDAEVAKKFLNVIYYLGTYYLPLPYLVSLYQLAFTKCIKQYLLPTCKLRLIKENHTKYRSSKLLLFWVWLILNQSVQDDLPQMILYSTWLK